MTMGWDWTDQAHSQASRDEIEAAMRGDLAGAFEAEAIKNATARQVESRPGWDRPVSNAGLGFRGALLVAAVVAILAVVMFAVH